MSQKYTQIAQAGNVRFSEALFGEVERSSMTATPLHLTTFNAGDIIPIYCQEILPNEGLSLDVDFVIRQNTLLTPTMGQMVADIYAFFVPNRVVNQSWKAVEGENYSGSWTANPVTLAPLYNPSSPKAINVPVGSVADYYGFPTQAAISSTVLQSCHDLKFRGYVMIWNEFFRDQNYQPPIPMSTLNIYQGFFDQREGAMPNINLTTTTYDKDTIISGTQVGDGSFGAGAVAEAIYGSSPSRANSTIARVSLSDRFYALGKPLKANKLHDYFTSVLPSPQKGPEVFTPVTGQISKSLPVLTNSQQTLSGAHPALFFNRADGISGNVDGVTGLIDSTLNASNAAVVTPGVPIYPANLSVLAGATVDGLEISLSDIRMASAIQQVYETLARGGSRYRELVSSFFGIDVDDPFSDIPQCLGHIRRDLDLFQTAQTSASQDGNTPQGNLAAFGYTASNDNHLFAQTFVEHGYVHVFAVVRHRNIYSSYMGKDNFRRSMLDFYMPPLANISEQPVYTYQINPFAGAQNVNGVFGYQEAWAEYRFEVDNVSGYMRPGINESLSLWNYADDVDTSLLIADGTWLQSNSQKVLDRTLAVTSDIAHQFKGQFKFIVHKELPMPTYSVSGMDII